MGCAEKCTAESSLVCGSTRSVSLDHSHPSIAPQMPSQERWLIGDPYFGPRPLIAIGDKHRCTQRSVHQCEDHQYENYQYRYAYQETNHLTSFTRKE